MLPTCAPVAVLIRTCVQGELPSVLECSTRQSSSPPATKPGGRIGLLSTSLSMPLLDTVSAASTSFQQVQTCWPGMATCLTV